MSSRHAEYGAGYVDAPEYVLKAYRVKVHDGDAHFWLSIPSALGEHDARNQAIEHGREQGIAFEIGRIEPA